MKDLRITCPDDVTFHKKRANRSVTARRRDFNYLFSKFTKEKFGGHQEGMFVKLADVPPLMKCVHKDIEQAAELVFVNATSNTEAHN